MKRFEQVSSGANNNENNVANKALMCNVARSLYITATDNKQITEYDRIKLTEALSWVDKALTLCWKR